MFDPALQVECMSSEESDGEEPDAAGEMMQVFRTRGLPWRSSRLRKFYASLDDHGELNGKPRRGVGRRTRREGPPKDGLSVPPKGVSSWMISKRWQEEVEAAGRLDIMGALREHVVDATEAELNMVQELLGAEGSDDEQDQTGSAALPYAQFLDTSYTLGDALRPF